MIFTYPGTPWATPQFSQENWQTVAERLEFSRRESQVVRLVFDEKQDGTIADELGISVNSVQTYLKRVYLKLGVASRAGMVLRIVREHIIIAQEAEVRTPGFSVNRPFRKAA